MAEESPYVRLVGSAPEQFNMQHLEQRLYREFTEHEISRAQLEEQARPLYQQLTEQAGQGAAENDVRALRERDYNLAQPSLEAPDPASTPPEMLYVRSVGATRTPPYDWGWTWEAHNGDANGSTRSADKNTGRIRAYEHPGNNGGAVSGRAAVGIHFRPPLPGTGTLDVHATPSFNFKWWTYCSFASAHSDGWLGLYIAAFDRNNTFISAPVDQRIMQWNESHSGLSRPDGSGANGGFPLSARLFVNGDLRYEIWVWCGGTGSASGDHTFYGSYSGSNLSVTAPWIHWEYWR